jgi:hypothetical protein
MNANMKLWNSVSQPPKHALKQIGGGRLKGMTDINPQWRLQAMTEAFGQIGVGWYYEIVRMWTENGASGEVMVFVHANLYTLAEFNCTTNEKTWSMPITGIGGSTIIAKEQGGLHANDEGYKMALTDALGVAMKQLGVAADIYVGLWDGSKYREIEKPKPTPNEQKQIYKESLLSANTIDELTDAWKKIPKENKVQELINIASKRKEELTPLPQKISEATSREMLDRICENLTQEQDEEYFDLIQSKIDEFQMKDEK